MITISTLTLMLVFFWHWLFDFYYQSDEVAVNKSKSLYHLSKHSLYYTCGMMLFGWKFALINGISHFFIDFFTSKINSWLYKHEMRHEFFSMIGFDQFMHFCIIFKTLKYIW